MLLYRIEGNSFDNIRAPAPAPSPQPTQAPAPNHEGSSNRSQTQPSSRGFNGSTPSTNEKKYHRSSISGAITGIVLGSLVISLSVTLVVVIYLRCHAHRKEPVKKTSKSSSSSVVLGKYKGKIAPLSNYDSLIYPLILMEILNSSLLLPF